MNANQLIEGIGKAVTATKEAPEYCILSIDHWSTCMTKAEWSGWMQFSGSILALIVAIFVPWFQSRNAAKKQAQEQLDVADITIRFHWELLETNDSMLDVALRYVRKGENVWLDSEVMPAIFSLRAVDFSDIKQISVADPGLAKHLADFHCQLERFRGVISRQAPGSFVGYETVIYYLELLKSISIKIRELTVN